MDSIRANALEKELVGKSIDGWVVEKLIDHGKSAAVFLARRDGQPAAVKIFDNEIIERYGDSTQLERINRELELRGKSHPNLVSIYGGGYDEATNFYFVVMGYVDGRNLKKENAGIPIERVPDLVAQIAGAAEFLEGLGLVHRDIKPENIVLVENGTKAILLDLGVVRPIKGSDLTDPDGIQAFIGTLQYASPEFLLREEEQTLLGYRALTFYQIGAVLHDLIMKRPLFEQFATPYAKLVNAVQKEKPVLFGANIPYSLTQLAERCLLKSPTARLRLLSWASFRPIPQDDVPNAKERVAERLATFRAVAVETGEGNSGKSRIANRLVQSILDTLKTASITTRASLQGLPPMKHVAVKGSDASQIDLVFSPKADAGMPFGLNIRIKVELLEEEEAVIACLGCACLPGREATLSPDDYAEWFAGPLDNTALNERFEQFFFGTIDWCVQTSPGVDASFGGVYNEPEGA